jgi:hypothetical protein
MPYGLHPDPVKESPLLKMCITFLCLIIDIGMIWFNEIFSEEYHKKIKKLEK